MVVVLVKEKFGNIDIVKFGLGSGFVYPFGNGFPIFSRFKRRSNGRKWYCFLEAKERAIRLG